MLENNGVILKFSVELSRDALKLRKGIPSSKTAGDVAKACDHRASGTILLALVSRVQGCGLSFEFLADTVTASLKGCHKCPKARF